MLTVPPVLFPLPRPCSLIERQRRGMLKIQAVEYLNSHTELDWIMKDISQGGAKEMA